MNATQIEEFTASISGFEPRRKYIGLSNVHLDVGALVDLYNHGSKSDHLGLLKCYKGYQMEKDLLERLKKLYGYKISTRDIVVHGGLVQGHPDFWYDQDIPGDCKSVLLDAHLPEDKLPRKVFWQLQGYMLYSNTVKALAIYESRESGRIRHKWINRNEAICREIKTKIDSVLELISVAA
jgi:hypothetical protein